LLQSIDVIRVFLDEPTSGLVDEQVAEEVVTSLSHLAKKYNRTIISTIHQPSWQVFQKFDKVVMLNKGRVVYHGDASTSVINYFEAIGYELPVLENPLTYYVRKLEKEDEVDFFAKSWDEYEDKAKVNTVTKALAVKDESVSYEVDDHQQDTNGE
jgi:ABC-type multidrug transport system ATPase subunit